MYQDIKVSYPNLKINSKNLPKDMISNSNIGSNLVKESILALMDLMVFL